MILNYYGHKFCIKENISIPFIGMDSEFHESVNIMYDKLPIANDPNQKGIAKSTVLLPNDFILKLTNVSYFIQSICKHISSSLYDIEKFTGEFHLTRFWSNRMYRGACGSSHIHNTNCDYVAIYYYEAPENCSMFIVNGFEDIDSFDFDLSKNNKIGIQVNEGTLIVHPSSLNHSISENLTDDHRTVFVFEISKK